ncbi:LexA family protein [Xanthomonas campestris]|uniref:S24 family peptidase n=1 Tax=Xanthomonas campestris pv. papavericola TaxID=487881 RepID=A0AAJ2X584_XANCA|nr:S24 family peptidase [Xanthomonas campestris]MDO0843876.1 S24 family peptidase [Xanthomonas campestris pv. campestris]MEA0706899.1 S24 family peptidase [Xanthomonas campestris pv. campestris]MEA0719226.1 S24 family peptidase [Xanthomonas campestris pv. campestris]MEA0740140.1 S24 family peptidase [Xanthomonas campestris pv. campestris]MEA0767715.1 S24 family peptidase [Xanthomonas campestris pv. campestris]
MIGNPVATFFATAEGDSMRDLGIEAGDTLVIDKSLDPKHLDIVIVNWEGGFMVKQLRRRGGRLELHSGNPATLPSSFPMTWGWMSGAWSLGAFRSS